MTFRRKSEAARAWHAWRETHRDALAKCGLPGVVLESEDHWWDFLMHGYLDHHDDPSRFTVDALTQTEASHLLSFLERVLSPEEQHSAHALLNLRDLVARDT